MDEEKKRKKKNINIFQHLKRQKNLRDTTNTYLDHNKK